jgi:hypothetical protein
LSDDTEIFEKMADRYGTTRWVIIPNTLHLETLYVSPDLAGELASHPRCSVDDEPVTVRFANGRHQLAF